MSAVRFTGARLFRVLCVIAAVALLPVLTLTGCTNCSPRPTTSVPGTVVADNASVQSGKLLLAAHEFRDIYYPTPYAGNPQLDVPGHWGNCQVVTQSPTHFRVMNHSDSELQVDWKASGTKAAIVRGPDLGTPQIQQATVIAPAQPAAAPASATLPPPPSRSNSGGLPTEPVPVTSPK
jgi:hypothetical protein